MCEMYSWAHMNKKNKNPQSTYSEFMFFSTGIHNHKKTQQMLSLHMSV